MVRDVAATLYLHRLDARNVQDLLRGYDVRFTGPATESKDRLVFDQKHEIFLQATRDLRPREVSLPLETGGIWNPPLDRNKMDGIHRFT